MDEHPPGKLDVRILEQSTFWINAKAEILRINEMSDAHITHVITMFEENPTRYHLAALINEIIDLVDALASGEVPGTLLAYEITGENLADIPPKQWLETTPLMRELQRTLQERENNTTTEKESPREN